MLLLKSLVLDSGLGLEAFREWARRNTGLGVRGQGFSLHSLSYLPLLWDSVSPVKGVHVDAPHLAPKVPVRQVHSRPTLSHLSPLIPWDPSPVSPSSMPGCLPPLLPSRRGRDLGIGCVFSLAATYVLFFSPFFQCLTSWERGEFPIAFRQARSSFPSPHP